MRTFLSTIVAMSGTSARLNPYTRVDDKSGVHFMVMPHLNSISASISLVF